MEIIEEAYLSNYKNQLQVNCNEALKSVGEIELSPKTFTFYTSVAVIASSRIEGEQMELDSYVKHKVQHIDYLPELVEKTNDLYLAYLFAKDNTLSEANFIHTHQLLTKHLLPEKDRGVYRKNEMLVMEHKTGRIQFEAAPFAIVTTEMDKLWMDINNLLLQNLSVEEVFYYASFIHLVFVCIHPFNDGNGRAARLLEKWFLAQKLGEIAWYFQSEKYYYHNVNSYYKNLNRLGVFYEQLDYGKADAFLLMLPNAINYEG
ncbi:Fic family protein [Parasediminibacterium paludis]|uniref:Fic family protein n=1 Tax=Parasediminibacterium paludis TaxID=908966 RepID=A0ABV8PVK6_9BACT